MGKKLGTLIKDARTAADLTQEKLAKKLGGGLSASDVSKVEHGEMELTQAQVKKAAAALGVTQKSLLDAMPKTAAKKTSTATRKTATVKKAATPANANSTMKVTATERKLVEAYRTATSDQKKAALSVLKGENPDVLSSVPGSLTSSAGKSAKTPSVGDLLSDAAGDLLGNLLGGK